MPVVQQVYREIGQRIRSRRQQVGLTQAELGQRLGLSRTSMTNVEQGRQRLPLHQLLQVTVELQTTTGALLTGLESAPTSAEVRGLHRCYELLRDLTHHAGILLPLQVDAVECGRYEGQRDAYRHARDLVRVVACDVGVDVGAS